MGLRFSFSDLYKAPEVNPVNRKARSVPILDPINVYGRVFFFSWFGFMIAFWAWYAFPPLLTATIKHDLHLTTAQIANSNIVSLCATLIVRVIAGPLCDQYGPRKVFAGCLLLGSIPVGLAPLIQTANGLYASRFFIGILGGSFVPCQVWSTGFFDKNIVGTANAFTGGWGNAGGGITYFIMPAVYDSFVSYGYSMDQAWRLTFIVPLIMLLVTGFSLLLLCPDTPVGKWSERERYVQEHPHTHSCSVKKKKEEENPIVAVPGSIIEKPSSREGEGEKEVVDNKDIISPSKLKGNVTSSSSCCCCCEDDILQTAAQGEVIVKPSTKEIFSIILSLPTWTLMLCYACSFGGELAINSVLSSYYLKNFPTLGQTRAANWAAMFGFLNFVTRPLGGILADVLYNYANGNNNNNNPSSGGDDRRRLRGLWWKKAWVHICGILTGTLLLVLGRTDPHDQSIFTGLVGLTAIFLEAGNGANFALVPHVHPCANGVVSGLTGALGNMGGILSAVIFRFMGDGTDYAKAFWVIGWIHVGLNVVLSWVRPVPKGQIGGY